MKKNILIFVFCLISSIMFGQRQIPQHSTLWHKIQDVQRLYFSDSYYNPIHEYYKIGLKTNYPAMIIDDKIAFSNVESSTRFDNYSLADIDRIEYITASEMQATNDVVMKGMHSGGENGVVFIYTKAFINSNPATLHSSYANQMGYPNLVKRAYTKP